MNIRELVPWGRHKREEEELYRNGGDATLALRSDLNRVFDSFWNRLDLPGQSVWDEAFGRSALPRVDIRDLDKEIEVVAELPGMDERDVSVGVAEERTSGRIERIVPLPPDLDVDSARARFKNGVLTITIAKTPEAQAATRQIPVRRG